MKDIKFRAWDGKQMLNRTLYDRNWYNEDDKCIRRAMPRDSNTLKVMQYTGLKDKDGKGLDWWEDDILEDEDGYRFQIKYIDDYMRFGLLCLADLPIENYYFLQYDYDPEDFKKVGNIHDNPELLE